MRIWRNGKRRRQMASWIDMVPKSHRTSPDRAEAIRNALRQSSPPPWSMIDARWFLLTELKDGQGIRPFVPPTLFALTVLVAVIALYAHFAA